MLGNKELKMKHIIIAALYFVAFVGMSLFVFAKIRFGAILSAVALTAAMVFKIIEFFKRNRR